MLSKKLKIVWALFALTLLMLPGCSTDSPPPAGGSTPGSSSENEDEDDVTASNSGAISNALAAAMQVRLEDAGMESDTAEGVSGAAAQRARTNLANARAFDVDLLDEEILTDETPEDLPAILADMASALPEILADPEFELTPEEIGQYLPEATGGLAEALSGEEVLAEIVDELEAEDVTSMISDMVSDTYANILESDLDGGALNNVSTNLLGEIMGEFNELGLEDDALSDAIQETVSAAVESMSEVADEAELNSRAENALYESLAKGGMEGVAEMDLSQADMSNAGSDVSVGVVAGLPEDISGSDFTNLVLSVARAIVNTMDWTGLQSLGLTNDQINTIKDTIVTAIIDAVSMVAVDTGHVAEEDASGFADSLNSGLENVQVEYVTRPYYLWAMEGWYAESLTPTIYGYATSGHEVNLYDNSTCSGNPVGTATADEWWMFSIPVSVSEGSINSFYATATDPETNLTSNCSWDYAFYQQVDNGFDESTINMDAPAVPSDLALAGYYDYSTYEVVAGAFDYEENPQISPIISGSTDPYAYVGIYSDSECYNWKGAAYADENGDFTVWISADYGEQSFYAQAWNVYSWISSGCSTESLAYSYEAAAPTADEVGWIDYESSYTSGLPGEGVENFYAFQIVGTASVPSYIYVYDDATCSGNFLGYGSTDADGNYAAILYNSETAPSSASILVYDQFWHSQCVDVSSLFAE